MYQQSNFTSQIELVHVFGRVEESGVPGLPVVNQRRRRKSMLPWTSCHETTELFIKPQFHPLKKTISTNVLTDTQQPECVTSQM